LTTKEKEYNLCTIYTE